MATKDYHIDPGSHFSENPDFKDSWPPHCVVGTAGVDFHPAFDPAAVEAVFHKGHYSAAYSGFEGAAADDGTSLADWLRAKGVDAVDVVGIATDYCVKATAADAVAAGFTTRVLLDLTAGVSPTTTAEAVDALRAAGVAVAELAAHQLRRRHHVLQRRRHLVGVAGLQPAVRVHPEPFGGNRFQRLPQRGRHLVGAGHAR